MCSPCSTPDRAGRRTPRLLLGGATTSLLGDQFALIATPWLALQLTGDPLALGLVLALGGLPRAGFMLVGGAVTDRFAARRVMIVADITRGVLTAAMAGVVLAGVVQMWMLFGFALAFGLVAGFAVPAENSIVWSATRPGLRAFTDSLTAADPPLGGVDDQPPAG